jgi:hypothetical protein
MRGNKGVIGLALIAALALMVATVGATASASGGARLRRRRSKKKKKAQSAKKKKCKKKKGTTTTPISKVRATLTWSGGGDNTDYDLYVFDPSGGTGRAVSNQVSKTSFTPNAIGSSGTETFTDLDFGAHRAFAFGVCHQDGGNDGSSFTIDYVSASGVNFTDSQAGTGMATTPDTATAAEPRPTTHSPARRSE